MATGSLQQTRSAAVSTAVEPEVELQSTDCPLCGRDHYDVVIDGADRFSPAAVRYRVVRCRGCGFAYTNPRPTPAAIGRCYPADYGCHKPREAVKRGLRERFHQYLETATLRSLHGYPPQPVDALTSCLGRLGNWYFNVARRRSQWIDYRGQGRLLDFGCGAGVFLERMRNRGWTVEGVEVSGAVAEDVRRRTGIQVHAGSLPHANLHDRQFDVVAMWQSLEHVHNPREVIAAARQLVAPQGQLLVAVPNLACWSFQTFGEHWFALDVPRHLNHFTPLTLTKLIESEGFVVQRIQHVGLDGWIRHSARTALDHGASPRLAKACLWKPIAVQAARRSQRREQGDVILAWADPV